MPVFRKDLHQSSRLQRISTPNITLSQLIILCIVLCVSNTENYYADLNFQLTHQKDLNSTFDEVQRFSQNSAYFYELYTDGQLTVSNLLYNKQQTNFFCKINSTLNWDSNSNGSYNYDDCIYPEESLIDWSSHLSQQHEIYFLLNTSQIVGYDLADKTEVSRQSLLDLNITSNSSELSINSKIGNTNESIYLISNDTIASTDNFTIYRLPKNQFINTTVLIDEFIEFLTESNNQTSTDINEFLNSTDYNISDVFYSVELNKTFEVESLIKYMMYSYAKPKYITQESIVTGMTGKFKVDVCKKWHEFDELIAIWDGNGYVEIYKCLEESCESVSSMDKSLNPSLSSPKWTVSFKFDHNCDALIVSSGLYAPIQVIDLSGTTISTIALQSTPFVYIGSFDQASNSLVVIFTNGSMNIWKQSNAKYKFSYDFSDYGYHIVGNQSEISELFDERTSFIQSKRRLLFYEQDSFTLYKFECWEMMFYNGRRTMCKNCSDTCATCNQWNGHCLTCIENHTINFDQPKQCIFEEVIEQSVQQLEIDDSSDPLDQNNIYGAIYSYEYELAQATISGFQIVASVTSNTLTVIQMLPLAWLFLQFLNFWTICSFYLFLDVDMPQYFRMVLRIIYEKLNTTILPIQEGLSQLFPSTKKLTDYSQYGISSNFVAVNTEVLIMLTSTVIIFYVLQLLRKKLLKQDSWLSKKMDMDFIVVLSGQYVSFMASFYLPFNILLQSSQSVFVDKVNLTLHISLMGFSLIFPLLYLSHKFGQKQLQQIKNVEKAQHVTEKAIKSIFNIKPQPTPEKSSDEVTEKESQDYSNQKHKLNKIEWLYVSNCNSIIPILAITYSTKTFLLTLFLYHFLGLYLAWNRQSWRINSIILAIERIVFHLVFILMTVFGPTNLFIRHNSALVCLALLFFGALHETLSLFAEIIQTIYQIIKKMCSSVEQEPPKEQESGKVDKVQYQDLFRFLQKSNFNQNYVSGKVFKISNQSDPKAAQEKKIVSEKPKKKKIRFNVQTQSKEHLSSLPPKSVNETVQFKDMETNVETEFKELQKFAQENENTKTSVAKCKTINLDSAQKKTRKALKIRSLKSMKKFQDKKPFKSSLNDKCQELPKSSHD